MPSAGGDGVKRKQCGAEASVDVCVQRKAADVEASKRPSKVAGARMWTSLSKEEKLLYICQWVQDRGHVPLELSEGPPWKDLRAYKRCGVSLNRMNCATNVEGEGEVDVCCVQEVDRK